MKQRVQQAVESVQNEFEGNGNKSNISVCCLLDFLTNRLKVWCNKLR